MTTELTFYQLLGLAFALIGAFWALGKLLLAQVLRSIDERFVQVNTTLAGQNETSRRLERELMELKAELPRDYVRREDYTQAIATIMTKLDAMALRFENVLLRQTNRNGGE